MLFGRKHKLNLFGKFGATLINERAREEVITKSTWKVSQVAREVWWDGQVGVMIEKIEPETGQSVFRPRLKSN